MRCPARVRYARRAREWRLLLHGDKLCHFPACAKPSEPISLGGCHRQASRIVSSVLKLPKAIEQQRDNVALADSAYDSTHISIFSVVGYRCPSFFARAAGGIQFFKFFWRPLATASSDSPTSLLSVEPAAT